MPRAYSDAHYADVQATLEFGHSHNLARQVIPIALGAIALGLLLNLSFDGRTVETSMALLGTALIVGAFAFIALAIWRRSLANVASIVISPAGVLLRDISEKPIPWREITAVGLAKVRHSKDFTSTEVVKLEVSKVFYERYSGGRWLDSVIAEGGDPSAIYLSYYHALPVEKVRDAITRRWQWNRGDVTAASADAQQTEAGDERSSTARDLPLRGNAIRNVGALSSLGVLAGMLKEQTLGERAGSLIALAAIGAVLSNMFGLWSTEQQQRGRLREAQWRAEEAIRDAEQKAWDEERRKSEAKWDAIKKCMEQMGSIGEDPNCSSKIK